MTLILIPLSYLLLALLFHSINFAQSVKKVLISGFGGQHDIYVEDAFKLGYASYDGTPFEGSILRYYDTQIVNSLNHARDNGYEMLIRSTTGIQSAVYYAPDYPGVQIVMPAGSNSYRLIFSGDIVSCPVVVCGAGDDVNETGYKIEFFSHDPITIEPDYSSYSNGYIAGQLAFLANYLGMSLQDTRLFTRQVISGGAAPDFYDGYGKIDVDQVIRATLPVELIAFNANSFASEVLLNWETATEENNYGFEVERRFPKDSDADGESEWSKIGFIEGNGNSNSTKYYSFSDKNPPEGRLLYRIKQIDLDGRYSYSESVEIDYSGAKEFALEQNYPNPFNPTTNISFKLGEAAKVTVRIFNAIGEEVAELVNRTMEAGRHSVLFDAGGLPSGTYFCRMNSGGFAKTTKLLLIK